MSRVKVWIVAVAMLAVGAAALTRLRLAASRIAPSVPVAIEVDAAAREPLDGAHLSKRAVDRRYESWRLWRLAPLLGVDLEGAVVVLDHADGKLGGFSLAQSTPGVEPWFAVDDKGRTAVILATSTARPLPALGVVDGIAPLTRIRVTTRAARAAEMPNSRTDGAETAGLSITFGDGRSTRWTIADLERVPAREQIPTERGNVPGWSLRDVAATLVGARARVGSMANVRGEATTISAADWSDPKRTPVLRVNQRGSWKFDWIDSVTKKSLSERSLRDVSTISFSSR